MQVKGEAIEAHISDKEATYQSSISVLYIINRECISEAYISSISVLYINNRAYQRCISARSLRSLSGQSHLGKLFKSRTFMVDICK
jgi:hypothetical protein